MRTSHIPDVSLSPFPRVKCVREEGFPYRYFARLRLISNAYYAVAFLDSQKRRQYGPRGF
jgi:hypothetical protein